MEKQNSKKMGLINGIVLLVITLGALYLANDTQSSVAMASVVLLGIGTLISIFSFVQGHLISREQDEELEMQVWIKLAAMNHSLPELPKMPTPLVTQEGNLKSG